MADSWLESSADVSQRPQSYPRCCSLSFRISIVLESCSFHFRACWLFPSCFTFWNKTRGLLVQHDSNKGIFLRHKKSSCWRLPQQGNSEANLKYLSQFILRSVAILRVFRRMHELLWAFQRVLNISQPPWLASFGLKCLYGSVYKRAKSPVSNLNATSHL